MNTLVVGATPNPMRYAFTAMEMLHNAGFDFVPVGVRRDEVFGKPILHIRDQPQLDDIHTVTLYVGPAKQPEYYDYLLSLKPERIIFNPGTENKEFARLASQQGINVVNACTLVMISTGQY